MSPAKIFIIITLEIIFLTISFIFIGLGVKEIKKKRNIVGHAVLIAAGILFALVSLYCTRILLLY